MKLVYCMSMLLIIAMGASLPNISLGANQDDLEQPEYQEDDTDDTDDADEAKSVPYTEAVLSLNFENQEHSLYSEISDELPQPGITAELELGFSREFERFVAGYINLSLTVEHIEYSGQPRSINDEFVQLDELWLQMALPIEHRLTVRVGRQLVTDGSGWWWDDELNGISVFGNSDQFSYEVALLQQDGVPRTHALQKDPELEDIYWALGSLTYQPNDKMRLGLRLASRADTSSSQEVGVTVNSELIDERDDKLHWLGLHLGQIIHTASDHKLEFMVDTALLVGQLNRLVLDEESDDIDLDDDMDENAENELASESTEETISGKQTGSVNAWAFWTSLSWTPAFSPNHSVSLQYALGSGTNANNRTGTGTFQQTGLHSNEQDSHLLGEVLDPELANLHVASVQLTGAVSPNTSYRLSHYRYYRESIQDNTFETDIELDLNDTQSALGYESAVSFQVELSDMLEAEFTYARFSAGPGIDSGSKGSVNFIGFEVSLDF